jgi:hypothetical protein
MDQRIKVWLKFKHIVAALNALQFWGTHLHEDARHEHDPTKSDELRAEASTAFEARKELWEQQHAMKDSSSNDSIHGNSAPVQVTRFTLPKDPREIMVALLLALSISVNVWCISVIRDAGTEERLKQYNLDWFKTHEFSDLKAEVAVNQKLIEAYGLQKTLKEK